MTKIAEVMVQNGERCDDFLHKKLFLVNERLFINNMTYRNLITHMLNIMEKTLHTDFSDYATLKGISGANMGFPYNLVVVVDGDDTIRMINPEFKPANNIIREVKSNCGSLNLDDSITVKRFKKVIVSYVDERGKHKKEIFTGALGSTIQHEIEHNNGILIIDK